MKRNRVGAEQRSNLTDLTQEGMNMMSCKRNRKQDVVFKALMVGLASLVLMLAGSASSTLAGPSHGNPPPGFLLVLVQGQATMCADGKPAQGVQVILFSKKKPDLKIETTTNSEGKFSASAILFGAHVQAALADLGVEFPGYAIGQMTSIVLSMPFFGTFISITTCLRYVEAANSKITGFKFEDLNGNGLWERDREPAIEGWEIRLTGPEGERKTKTDTKGHFEFFVRMPGTYTVSEEFHRGWISTTGNRSVLLRLYPPEVIPDILFGNKRQEETPLTTQCSSGFSLEDAARTLLSTVSLTPNMQVLVMNKPLPQGTVISSSAPPEVEVVSATLAEESFVFFIDDDPTARFGHPMRYVVVGCSGGISVLNALWRPQIEIVGLGDRALGAIGEVILADFPFTLLQDLPAPSNPNPPSIPPPEQSAAPGPCQVEPPKKYALVLDAGDENTWKDLADDAAANADGMEKVLKDKGYEVRRFSQYWDSSNPPITKGHLKEVIKDYARRLRPCDELFIYIVGHGASPGFALYDRSGNGDSVFIRYDALDSWLDELPDGVQVTVMIDSCKSGGAIRYLRDTDRTIITATDDRTNATGGDTILSDSFTEDFLEAFESNSGDTNGDGKVDWREAFEYAKKQGPSYNPQYHEGP